MSLSQTQVSQIAYLARLSLSDEQIQSNTEDLNAILALAEELASIDTDGVSPMAHPLHMSQRLREDVVSENNNVEAFQAVAPKVDNQHYLVPTVIE